MKIYCTGCEEDVEARLTDGQERYPHRPDLEYHNGEIRTIEEARKVYAIVAELHNKLFGKE